MITAGEARTYDQALQMLRDAINKKKQAAPSAQKGESSAEEEE